jgi:hypothetical protein
LIATFQPSHITHDEPKALKFNLVDPISRLDFPEGSGDGSTLHTVSDVHDVNDFLEEHAVLDDIDECDVRDSLMSMTAFITVLSVEPLMGFMTVMSKMTFLAVISMMT